LNSKKINLKFFAILLLGVMSASCYFVYSTFVQGYVELDQKATKDSLTRVHQSLMEQQRFISEKIVDWATWDDTALFVRGQNKDFIEMNLTEVGLSALNIDFVAILSLDMKVIGTGLPGDQQYPGEPTGKFAFLDPSHSLISTKEGPSSVEFVQYGDQIAIATAHTVARGDGSDPGGKVVFLKTIDSEMLKRMSEQNNLSIELVPGNVLSDSPNWQSLSFGGYENRPKTALGLVAIKGPDGKVLSYLRTEIPRDVLLFGIKTAKRLIILMILIFSGLIAAFVSFTLFFAKTQELKRKAKIVDQLSEAQALASIGGFEFSLESGSMEVSDQTKRILGSTDQELNVFEAVNAKLISTDKERWKRFTSQAILSSEISMDEFQIVTHEGPKTIQVRLTKSSVAGNSSSRESVFFKGTIQDVSAKVFLEKELEEQRNISMRNSRLAALGEMSAGVAHEINNPLTIIESNLLIIQEKQLNPEQIKSRLERISKATHRITKIVGGLKKFSGNFAVVETIEVDLSKIIQDSLIDVEIKAEIAGVNLSSEVNEMPQIKANPIEIEQLLVILVNNAIDAVRNLEQRWVKVILGTSGNYAVIQVWDSGKGIPLDVASKLFQPFFTTKAVGEGTGLGLSIAKGIVDGHHGSIEVIDTLDNTCFEIRFPLAQAKSDQVA
jgi:nitrogen-specific signal transduction histidine kinase